MRMVLRRLTVSAVLVAAVSLASGCSSSGEGHQAGGTGEVYGRVTDLDGRPIAGARITGEFAGKEFLKSADSGGQYVLPPVPAGQGEVRVVVGEVCFRNDDVTVAAGKRTRVDFAVITTVKGVVRVPSPARPDEPNK